MRKIIALLLVIFAVCSVAACDSAPGPAAPPANEPAAPPANEPAAPPANEPAAPPADEPAAPPAADGDWGYIQGNGKLIIGITEYEPMNYYDADGNLTGFDTEFAEAVCAKLGITPDFTVINWDTKEIELAAKKIDCIWNGLTVTEKRKENIAFTQSYLMNEQVVVIRSADVDKYKDAGSLVGKTVVAEAGSAGESAIEADLADSNYVAVAAQASALLEVKSGTAEAAVIDLTMATAMTGGGTEYSDLVIVTSIKMLPEEYAIGFRIGSNCVAVFNDVIEELTRDGTLASIAATYDLTGLLIK